MAWERRGSEKDSKFVRFAAGTSLEGRLKEVKFRPSPFKEGELMIDIVLDIEGQEKVLSSSSANLKEIFRPDAPRPIEPGTDIRIEMITKGGKKLYNVYANG